MDCCLPLKSHDDTHPGSSQAPFCNIFVSIDRGYLVKKYSQIPNTTVKFRVQSILCHVNTQSPSSEDNFKRYFSNADRDKTWMPLNIRKWVKHWDKPEI